MKHSCGSMSEPCESKVAIPCSGNWESVLQSWYIDLFNLIVESRIPGINDRGYGDGSHCPPLLGPNVHVCELSKPECQKHQRLIHHLLRAVRHNNFEIEVLMLPDCCSEIKLSERMQKKEYILLEKWSMKCSYSKSQSTIEVSELLRAVRSFLHFSQISAWLSLTKGKSPLNIYYWVKPASDVSSIQFECNPEVHSFPVCKISDRLYGIVKVNYPPRTQYIPLIPCSKHPPCRGLAFRTLADNPSLSQNIPLSPEIVKQLQKTCDNQQPILSSKHCETDPEPLIITPVAMIKSFAYSVADVNKANRILKHSNSQTGSQITFDSTNLPCDLEIKKVNELSTNSETAFMCNYRASLSKCASQENLCLSKSLTTHISRKESKLKMRNKDLLPPTCEINSTPVIAHQYLPEQTVPKCCDVTSKLSNSELCVISSSNLLLPGVETSQTVSNTLLSCQALLNAQPTHKKIKMLKRKETDLTVEKSFIPHKKRRALLKSEIQLFKSSSNEFPSSLYAVGNIPQKSRKRKRHSSPVALKSATKFLYPSDLDIKSKDFLSLSSTTAADGNNESNMSLLRCTKDSNFSNLIYDQVITTADVVESNHDYNNKKCLTLTEVIKKNMQSESSISKLPKSNRKNTLKYTDSVNLYSLLKPSSTYSSQSSFTSNISITSQQHKRFPECNDESYMEKCKQDSQLQHCLKTDVPTSELYQKKNIFSTSVDINSPLEGTSHQVQELRWRKRYSKIFYKSKKYAELRKLSYCKNSISKILPVCSPSKLKEKMLNTLSTSMNIGVGCKIPYQASGSSEQVLNNSILETFASTRISENVKTNRVALPNKTADTALEKHLVKGRDTYISSQNFSNKYKNSTSISLHCDEHISFSGKESATAHLNTCNLNDTFSKSVLPERKVSASFVNPSCDQDFHASACKTASPSIMASPPYKEQSFPLCNVQSSNIFRTVLDQKATPKLDCFPRHMLKFTTRRKLLGNFEESILKDCLLPVNNVEGFRAEIGASGSFCPNHITLPAGVSFYELDSPYSGSTPYMARVNLADDYYLPKKGAVQVTLFNPSDTVVRMFVLNYDFSDMPPLCHTFIRQKTYYIPVGSTEECPTSQKWLRFIIHLRFASSKTGKIYLYKDFKIVVLNKSNDDAASEFSQEPRELRSFLHVPMNPTFSEF